MKDINRMLFDNLPEPKEVIGKNPILVTTSRMQSGVPGYQITFTHLNEGLLRKNQYTREDDSHFLSYPEWVHGNTTYREAFALVTTYTDAGQPWLIEKPMHFISNLMKDSGESNYIYVSEEGLELVKSLSYKFFYDKPEDKFYSSHTGSEVGSGSESLVFEAKELEFEKRLVVKFINENAQKTLAEFSGSWQFPRPNYLYKFGRTELVYKIIKDLETEFPFNTFTLQPSPKDLVAGTNLLIQEFVDGENLAKFRDTLPKGNNDKQKWLSDFRAEANELEELFFITMTERGGIFGELAPNLQNWILADQVKPKQRTKLILVDQATTKTSFAGAAADVEAMEAGELYKELAEKHKDSKRLALLRSYPDPTKK